MLLCCYVMFILCYVIMMLLCYVMLLCCYVMLFYVMLCLLFLVDQGECPIHQVIIITRLNKLNDSMFSP